MQIGHIYSQKDYEDCFHNHINEDLETWRFSLESIEFHNRFYDWQKTPVMTVSDNNEIVSVLFYNNTRDKYCSIINIVTPIKHRRKGYAKALMKEAMSVCLNSGATRIRLNCDHKSIDFYNSLNFVYWGVTRSIAAYCNMPLLDDFSKYKIIKDMSILKLIDFENPSVLRLINRRISDNLSTGPDKLSKKLIEKAGDNYLYDRLRLYSIR